MKALAFVIPIAFIVGLLQIKGTKVPGYELISQVAVVLIAAPAFYYFIKQHKRQGIFTLIYLSAFAVAIETMGILTGLPYGQFSYADTLGYKLFGTTPWTLMFTYVPLVIAAHALTRRFHTFVATLVFMDLILDPAAVALGYWAWATPGVYYGVPAINYFGWLVSSSLAYFIVKPLKQSTTKSTISAQFTLAFFAGYMATQNIYIPLVLWAAWIYYTTVRKALLND